MELLQQSGCGKAVANVRKYYFGGQVKHNDKEVAGAASSLRARWVDALSKGSASSSAPGTASTGASAGDARQTPAPSRTRSDPAQSSKKQQATSEESPRSQSPKRSPKVEVSLGGAKSRENGGRGSVGGGGSEGGRYGSGREEEKGSGEAGATRKEVKKEAVAAAVAVPTVAVDASAAVSGDASVKKEATPAVVLEEVRPKRLHTRLSCRVSGVMSFGTGSVVVV